jgi:protoporphyrinogen oxidase
MTERRVVVIGAGPAGLSAAYGLACRGFDVEVHEAAPFVGGLCRSLDLWGQRVDLGPHRFFSTDRRVLDFWHHIVGTEYAVVKRLTRIYYQGKFFTYPLDPWNVIAGLGPTHAAHCLLSYARAAVGSAGQELDTFEAWVTARFGRQLYETFFKTYSEKLWGIPGHDLDVDFATQRIKKLDLLEAVKAAFLPALGAGHRTLLSEFKYPLGGTGRVYERLAAKFVECGGRLALRSPVRRVLVDGPHVRGVELSDGRRIEAETVVSTMPLTLLVEQLDGCPDHVRVAAAALTFRNTILCYLEVEGTDHFPDNWLYVHAQELQCGRITNFRNWTPDLHGGRDSTILCLEFWANDDDLLWRAADSTLHGLAREELATTGLTGRALVRQAHVVRIKRSYPVYRRGYRAHIETIRTYLDRLAGLQVIGRYGAFKYNNQDHSLLMGLLAAEAIAGDAIDDPWSVNTAREYQEQPSPHGA